MKTPLLKWLLIFLLLFCLSSRQTQSQSAAQILKLESYGKALGLGTLTGAAWNTAHKTLALASSLGVYIFDDSTYKQLNHLDTEAVSAVAWDSQGDLLAVTTASGTSVWYVNRAEAILINHFDNALNPAWQPNHELLALLSSNSDVSQYTTKVFDVKSGAPIASYSADAFSRSLWSNDGKRLAITNQHGTVQIYQWPGSLLGTTISTQGSSVFAAFSPDGKSIATALAEQRPDGTTSNALQIWDARTGEPLTTIQTGLVSTMEWSPDSSVIAVASEGESGINHLNIWEVETGRLRYEAKYTLAAVRSLAWSKDGQTLMSANTNNSLQLWYLSKTDIQPLVAFNNFSGSVTALSWEASGKRLASGSDDGIVRIWDIDTQSYNLDLQTTNHTPVWAVDWNPITNLIASGNGDNSVWRWNLSLQGGGYVTNRHTYPINQGEKVGVLTVAWSPNGSSIASGGTDGIVRVRLGDVDQRLFQGDERWPVTSLAWNPDGSELASPNGNLAVWNVNTGQKRLSLQCQNKRVLDVAWSADNTLAGSSSSQICLWDAASGKLINTMEAIEASHLRWQPNSGYLAFIAFDPETAEKSLYIADTQSLSLLNARETGVQALAWHPADNVLAVGHANGQITFLKIIE